MTPKRIIKILRRSKNDDSIGVIRTNRDRCILRIVFGRGGCVPWTDSVIQEAFPTPAWIEVQLDPSEQIVGGFHKFVFTPAHFVRCVQDKDIKEMRYPA